MLENCDKSRQIIEKIVNSSDNSFCEEFQDFYEEILQE